MIEESIIEYNDDEIGDTEFCPVCKRDCCKHFGDTLNQLAQAQARIQELEGLVREMGEEMKYLAIFVDKDDFNTYTEILSRPQVQKIMEGKP